MAIENLYTYTETDPNSRLTLTQSQVTFTGLTGDEDTYLYKDKGVDYFSGDLIHLLTFRASAHVNVALICLIWALTNDIDDFAGLATADKNMVGVALNADGADRNIYLTGLNAGVQTGTTPGYVYSFNTTYYLKVRLDRSVGANGTIYLYIYSDPTRATLLDTQSYALSATQNVAYRYIWALMSRDFNGAAYTVTGWTENYELFNADTPIVLQQALTAITPTTATGHGIILSLGASAVTEHGHCWGTATAPTTANSKTTNGAGVVGTFTSAITGLTPGTKYYVRVYATNTQGTSYSDELSFIAGQASGQKVKGKLFIKGTDLNYVDDNGIERKITGTVV